MNVAKCLLLLALSVSCALTRRTAPRASAPEEARTTDLNQEIERLKKTVADLSRQVMRQKIFAEESVRTEGYSGVKVVRGGRRGRKNYEASSHLAPAAFTIHDHSNYDRTVGLGEMAVVLNGVEFRSRHNDYKLVMPSTTSKEYHAVEDIPFPEVPPEVLGKPTVQEQITEMREWFRAFSKQDKSIRDYRKYFKPVLCYMEGTWTLDQELVEPFPSDRHWLDATSWEDLHQKAQFTAYTGTKHRLENIALLPTTIMSVNMASGESAYAQWNYRVLCTPVHFDIPLSRLIQEDDFSFRVRSGQTSQETAATRSARFRLYDTTRKNDQQLLDDIFATIPGIDNHGGNLTFTVFGEDMFDSCLSDRNVLLNTAYYHRSYKSFKNGAGGITYSALGFNDENLWVAQTTQPRVAPLATEQCTYVQIRVGKSVLQCVDTDIRVSYAIPLEIIYMTPLLSWNPYSLKINNDTKAAIKDGRNGGMGIKALDGVDKFRYYMTPAEFFSGPADKSDPADTVKDYMYVQAPDGDVQKVSASGTSIILKEIDGVGKIRLRYPIAPVYGEGSSVWKELNALKDFVLESTNGPPAAVTFEMSLTVQDPPGEHTHEFVITYEEFTYLLGGRKINVTTMEAQEHTHDLTIVFLSYRNAFKYTSCDGATLCTDGHVPEITLETKNKYTRLP